MAVLAKMLMTVGGAFLIALGAVVTPLPGPFGVPIMLVGLVLILRGSVWVKRLFVRLMQKYPRVMRPLRALLRPGARVVSLLWLHSLRIERRFVPQRFRCLYRCRHDLRNLVRHRRPARVVTLSTFVAVSNVGVEKAL
ncbi:MAG: hypothetical protein ACTHLA_11615 [Asticcacaulis sp.]|uniref:hypothetical protein n=1 Tax=Asticcacaulis sp. TaxID=1872648 RepID=UPI003F7B5294